MYRIVSVLTCMNLMFFAANLFAFDTPAPDIKQTIVTKQSQVKNQYPSVVIFTLTTCAHCMEAKQYLNENKIPFVNREVDRDDAHMAELMKTYDSMGVPDSKRGVPLLVIGDKIRLQGFSKERFETAVKEVTKNQKAE